jgi:hypothetical protein
MKNKKLNVVNDMTCYDAHNNANVVCNRRSCPKWINFEDQKNCVVIAAKNGPWTLNEIGQIYGLSRMRICQLEKRIYEKIRDMSNA